ncbi:MAG: hypothetical protein ACQJCO_09175 [cyanobacterium endosymbiont of Rhopalodia sterrenbergii]
MAGNDTFRGGSENNFLIGCDDNDFVRDDKENDTLRGNNVNNELQGAQAQDFLKGDKGDDIPGSAGGAE